MKTIFLLFAITATLTGCSPNNPASPLGVWDVQCQEYRVVTATNDTTKINDIDKYYNTSHTPEYYEDWYGIKPTPTGYLFYDCEIK